MTDQPVEPTQDAVTELEDDLDHDDAAEVDQDIDDGGDDISDEERREALLADTPEELEARAPGLVETGNPAVDEVIASLEGLDGIAVDEHVALFEQAHEQLRRTLSGAGDDQG